MDNDKLTRLYDRVISGCKIVEDRGQLYVVRDPLSFHRMVANLSYDKAYDKYLLGGVPNLDGVSDVLAKRGIWGPKHMELVKKLQEEKKTLTRDLRNCEYKSETKKKTLDRIENINAKLRKLTRHKHYLSTSSAEYFAKIEYYKSLIFQLTYNIDSTRRWLTENDFNEESDSLIHLLIREAYLDDDIGESEIRILARSEPWRSLWVGAVKTGRFLERPLAEATELQRAAIQWSIIYDNAFESSDPPSMETVNNDALFDAWLEAQADKRASKNKNPDDLYPGKGGEIGIIAETIEDAKKVYNLNDASGKKTLMERQRVLETKGVASDLDMPDVKRAIQMDLNRNRVNAFKR